MYQSGKYYGHEQGFSCAFRQWRADSHCNRVHGYPLSFKLIFESDKLDKNGWIIDFGGLSDIKKWLASKFDHKMVVAEDDPHLDYFKDGEEKGVLDLVVLPAVGCERFAEYVYNHVAMWLLNNAREDIQLVSVTVAEHGANHATYINPTLDITKRAFPRFGMQTGI